MPPQAAPKPADRTPQFMAGPRDGSEVPKERRYDKEICVDMRHPWNILTDEYAASGLVESMAVYTRSETGDFIQTEVRDGRQQADS